MASGTRFNWRSLTAFIVTWAFLVATVTGTILYIVPQGRVAYWIGWTLAGLSKTGWAEVHILFGAVFIVMGGLHLYFNWKPFKKYLADRISGHLHPRKELIASLAATALLIGLAVGHLPPASWLFDLNAAAKQSWVAAPEYEPPYGHAEESSLAGLARRLNMDLSKVTAELQANGVVFTGPRQRVNDIAAANGMTSMQLFALIAKHQPTPPALSENGAPPNAAALEARFAGRGIGRKTIPELCAETGLSRDIAAGRLQAAGIEWSESEKLRAIAERRGLTPMQLVELIVIERKSPR